MAGDGRSDFLIFLTTFIAANFWRNTASQPALPYHCRIHFSLPVSATYRTQIASSTAMAWFEIYSLATKSRIISDHLGSSRIKPLHRFVFSFSRDYWNGESHVLWHSVRWKKMPSVTIIVRQSTSESYFEWKGQRHNQIWIDLGEQVMAGLTQEYIITRLLSCPFDPSFQGIPVETHQVWGCRHLRHLCHLDMPRDSWIFTCIHMHSTNFKLISKKVGLAAWRNFSDSYVCFGESTPAD